MDWAYGEYGIDKKLLNEDVQGYIRMFEKSGEENVGPDSDEENPRLFGALGWISDTNDSERLALIYDKAHTYIYSRIPCFLQDADKFDDEKKLKIGQFIRLNSKTPDKFLFKMEEKGTDL